MKKTFLSFFLFTLTSFAAATCNLNTPIIDSGFYNPLLSLPLKTTAKISVTCSEIQTITVKLSGGNSNNINDRIFSNVKNDTLHYNIFLDSSHSIIFGDGITSNAYSGPSGDINLFIKIPQKQNVSSGFYSDSLLIDVTF